MSLSRALSASMPGLRSLRWVVSSLAAMLLLSSGTGCGEPSQAREPGPTRIVVSIAPLAGLVRELAPDAEVTVLIPAGASEHGYELTSGDIARVGRADLVVGVGLGLEPRLTSLLASMGSAAPPALWFERVLTAEEGGGDAHAGDAHAGHDHDEHGHDDHDHHEHGVDPHLWLDPVLVERFIPVLGGALASASERAGSPVDADAMNDRTAALGRRVRELHERAAHELEPLADRPIVTHHASHGRFAARYNLRVAAVIRIAENLEPTSGQIESVVAAIRAESVPAVFVEPQFDATTAERIARAAGIRVAVLDPIGDGDWFALMDATVRTIVEALGTPADEGAG